MVLRLARMVQRQPDMARPRLGTAQPRQAPVIRQPLRAVVPQPQPALPQEKAQPAELQDVAARLEPLQAAALRVLAPATERTQEEAGLQMATRWFRPETVRQWSSVPTEELHRCTILSAAWTFTVG